MYFCYFVFFSPWKRAGLIFYINLNPLHPRMHCAKFGSNWYIVSVDDFCFIFINVFLLFRNYLPLEKVGAPSFKQTWIPFTQGYNVPSLVEINPVVQEKKMKMFKVYDNNNDANDNDDGQLTNQKKLTWAVGNVTANLIKS